MGLSFPDIWGEVSSWWNKTIEGLFQFIAALLKPHVTFSETLTANEDGWEGYCLVQRIEPVRLSLSGNRVRLTMRASSVTDAHIERVYISRPAASGKPYDSAVDLRVLADYPFHIQAGKAVQFALLPYNLDEGQPLLIAVDFSAAPPSGIRYTDAPPEQAGAYWRAGAEAKMATRSPGYTLSNRIYLIDKIEVSAA
jgi:hypothetical protein